MNKTAIFFAVLLSLQPLRAADDFSQAELARIGRKVWLNECNGSVVGLTSWNEGEDFASLGIGHFIWYPKGRRGPFEESFPKLLRFLEARGIKPPAWIANAEACPWNSRAEFQRDSRSSRMTELRAFLASTVPLQAA